MKQATIINKVVIAVLCLGVLLYLGLYFWQSYSTAITTTYAFPYTAYQGGEITGIIVRSEVVLSGSSQTVDLLPQEGERVSKGESVAVLYSNTSGVDIQQQISDLQQEIDQLTYAIQGGTTTEAGVLESNIISAIASVRASADQGDLTGLEDQTGNLRSLVLRRDYTYGDESAAADLEAALAARQAELASLTSSLGAVSTTVTAPVSGVFSGVADGYETLVTPEMLSSITVSQVDELLSASPTAPAGSVGKLITGNRWYFVATLDSQDLTVREGQTYTLSFSGDWAGRVEMTLERLGDVSDGRVPAVFSTNRYLSDTSLLRVQTVDLISQEVTGIRVPRGALRVVTRTTTDSESGQEKVEEVTGVYTVVAAQAEFQEVNVLYQDEDYYLVEPVDATSSHRLRAGDEVIVRGENLYDGKVVR